MKNPTIGRLQMGRSGAWRNVSLTKLWTLSYWPPVLLSLSSRSPVLLSSCLPVLLSSCPPVLLSSYPPLLLSSYPPVLLSSCHPVLLSYCPPVLLSPWEGLLQMRLPRLVLKKDLFLVGQIAGDQTKEEFPYQLPHTIKGFTIQGMWGKRGLNYQVIIWRNLFVEFP